MPAQGAPPPGANNFSCKPPARHPYPVVLVHGTLFNMTLSWTRLAPDLERLGYCVFALDYGDSATPGSNGRGDIPTSARQLSTFVDMVLAATHAKKVSIIGHSQGGMMPRYYIKFLGGASKVDDLVGLSPSSHGTTNPLAPFVPDCVACVQQIAGSPFMQTLNAGDQTPPPVDYTVIETRNDEVVTPYQSEFLPGPSDRVTNVLLQNLCPSDVTEHAGIIYDSPALQLAMNAVGRPGPADSRFRANCSDPNADAHFPDSNSVAARKHARHRVRLSFARKVVHRGSRLIITLRARGGRVNRVVVMLREHGRKVFTSAKRYSVRGKRRIVLRLDQKLKPGRYVLRAVGHDAAGHRVAASRAISIT